MHCLGIYITSKFMSSGCMIRIGFMSRKRRIYVHIFAIEAYQTAQIWQIIEPSLQGLDLTSCNILAIIYSHTYVDVFPRNVCANLHYMNVAIGVSHLYWYLDELKPAWRFRLTYVRRKSVRKYNAAASSIVFSGAIATSIALHWTKRYAVAG